MWRAACMAIAVAFATAAGAQQASDPSGVAAPTILTIDADRLFAQTAFGMRVGQEYTTGRADLAEENRRIAEGLREEELALADQRADMDGDVFLAEAEAFDTKAQAIRRAQDAKERALEDGLSQGREQFLALTRPILGQMMVDRRAFAVLDRRSVFLSLGSIDITDAAIVQIDAQLGDGARATTPSNP